MRDALMAASYAISLMLPLRLLLSLFLTKPKTHSGWYDSRWYGGVFVQSTPKPVPNFKSNCSCICILFSLTHPPMIFSAIRRYSVTWDFTNFPTPNPNWYDRSIRCMFWPEMGLRWHSLVQPASGANPLTMADSAAGSGTTLKLRLCWC